MRVSSIFCSVTSATACFSWISLASTLEQERILTAVSSSRMFPSEEESTSKILSSISFSCLTMMKCKDKFAPRGWRHVTSLTHTWGWCALLYLLFSAPCRMRACFSSSRSGLSRATTMPSSWSWMPSGVIMKFRRVTCRAQEEIHRHTVN